MNALSRSWKLTKLSLTVVRADKELLLFPLLGGLFSVIFVLALLYPTVITGAMAGDSDFSVLEYVMVFITYFGLSFIATFFNVCTVYTTKKRFEGGDATFKESLAFGRSKLVLIAKWSAVSATVGLLLHALDRLAERLGGAGEIIVDIIRGLVGMAWSVVTLFVVPVMVYRDLGPKEAIKASTEALKKTWGESLVRHFGLGLIQFAVMFLGALVFGGLLSVTGGGATGTLVIVLGISYFVLVVLLFSVLNAVFNTALYVYATTGSSPGGFDRDVVEGAFTHRRAAH